MSHAMKKSVDEAYLTKAASIFADTNAGFSSQKLEHMFSDFAIQFNTTAICSKINPRERKDQYFVRCMKMFSTAQQIQIILHCCNEDKFVMNEKFSDDINWLKSKILEKYSPYIPDRETILPIVSQDIEDWLRNYPKSKEQYDKAMQKYKNHSFDRNVLDDMRLSLEYLVSQITCHDRTLENQKELILQLCKKCGFDSNINHLFTTLFSQYTRYQDDCVKHHDKINELEVRFIIEITIVFMRLLIELDKKNKGVS